MQRAANPPVIDGSLDDACWKAATPIPVDFFHPDPTGQRSTEPRMTVRYLWDEDYLYIGYETFDKNLIALATDEWQGPKDNKRQGCEIYSNDPKVKVDVVEFFIAFEDMRFFWELHHNALNQFNDIWVTVTDPSWPVNRSSLSTWGLIFARDEYIHDDGPRKVAMAVKLKPKADGKPSTVNDESDEDTGYTAEIRLPWAGLGPPKAWRVRVPAKDANGRAVLTPGPWKMDGKSVRILAVVQDGDLKQRYYRSGKGGKSGWFHEDAPNWPVYIMKEASEAAK
jgi:hypothetical protein